MNSYVRTWLEQELSCYEYWCKSGTAGKGMWCTSEKDQEKNKAIRDWLVSVLK